MFDILGPYPVYLLVESLLAAVIWAAMTWPWNRAPRGPANANPQHRGSESKRQASAVPRSRGVPHGEPAGQT